MDHKPLPIGIDDFEKLVTRGYYFIDKTMFIKELLDKKGDVNLFTRPRRFGKTLNMSMLQYFFEDMRNDEGERQDNSYLFEGLKIMDAGDCYTKHMGRYPVISMSLKSAKQPDFKMAYGCLVDDIVREYVRHRYVLESDALTEEYRRRYQEIMGWKADADAYATALRFLSECLERYYGEKAIILIDEYDVPLENSFFAGFYDEMVAFIRSLFESALKTNSSLEFAVVTGCLRITKESIFTGWSTCHEEFRFAEGKCVGNAPYGALQSLNNLDINSVLNDNYAEHFGFTQPEVDDMLSLYGIGDRAEEVSHWYDGYLFGSTEVYNPWSMINYVKTAVTNKIAFPAPYWSNTSSNSIVKELVERADSGLKGEIELLLEGGTIEKPVHEDITYGDIHLNGEGDNEDNVWNFLFFTGYLKAISRRFEGETTYLTMTIPNVEVRYIYRNTILTWFTREIKRADYTDMYRALVGGEPEKVQDVLKGQLKKCISYFDNSEAFYHGFLAGTLGGIPDYLVKSNRESGNGRPDVLLVPLDELQPVIIIELKTVKKFPQMEAGCEEALRQIEEQNYAAELLEEGYEKFLKYGICFCKKSCAVKLQSH